jgi:hypothetical protein
MSAVSDMQISRTGFDLSVSWTSSYPAGTWYQVYLGRVLAWAGKTTTARLPYPPSGKSLDVAVLPLLSTDIPSMDYSSSLATPVATDRVTLTWLGGTFLGSDIAGYAIFGPASGSLSATPSHFVPAYDGVITDGFGLGGFSEGGFGESSKAYQWTSQPVAPGAWNWGVAPYDSAGNVGTPTVVSATTAGPPPPPAPYSDGKRVRYSYNAGTGVPNLTWQASP